MVCPHLLQMKHREIRQRVSHVGMIRPIGLLIDGQGTFVKRQSGCDVPALVIEDGQVAGRLRHTGMVCAVLRFALGQLLQVGGRVVA